MEYYTAKSFEGAERIGEPFEKNGKLYTKIREKCDRCVRGIYAVGVENGRLKPHPAFNGVCLKCNGAGWLSKEVRLYTEDELNKMEASNERARQRKAEALEAKMKAEYETKAAAWLEKNGFNKDKITYIYAGTDSYNRKEELKAAGFRFDSCLLWHKATKDEEYADNLIEVNFDEVLEFSAWGEGHYKAEAKSIIEKKIAEVQPKSTSTWVGEVGERLKKIPVTLIGLFGYEGKYGYSQVVKFQDENGNVFTWFTATNIPVAIGDSCLLTGTVKKLDTYKDEKTTILTRCRIEA